ncbi:glycosyltransferase [Accumulibacter sp.]|uniref:glycosyltransferase n=1 Tax=Accumulibacter sp. TaxID=2053492 RepID=UPI0035B427FE
MATIVLNWELGAALGHVGRYLTIALQLRAQGHRPVLVLRDISRAEAVLGPHAIEFLQAPVWLTPVQGLPPDLNFTETLYRFGFLKADGLLSIARAWRSLWTLLQPDLMLFDHAPTALLAARGFDVARVIVGNSFAVPPRVRPLPRYRWWANGAGDHHRLAETEERTTRNCNAVLKELGAPLIAQVADLFEAEATYLCARPRLDVYGERADANYVGPVNSLSMGSAPVWPAGDAPPVFAYLKSDYKHLDAVLGAIGKSRARFLIYAAGLPEQLRKRHESARVAFSATPLQMSEVVKQCAAIICHAGGMSDIALDHGKPLLLLPTQMEQTMTSHRVEALGAGILLAPDGNPALLPKLLRRLLDDESLAARAVAYAAQLPSIDQSLAVRRLVEGCEALLSGGANADAKARAQ